ncbi:Hypothetical predicted protein [Mytilus galloprovincialis]|uniref:Uncharacterized protein n=1 Tax=Mytilus galloprovincialis TaxID=29158 RepID=A0A8B6CKQ7_MYTGA|nr:Hypothetical predicted protein [Mytilus galloprovincialis]
MATSFKNPPTFDPRSMTYETWKNEISVWQLVTDLKVDKQALAVSLTLTGNAREVAMDVPAADLAKEDGMAKLITQLDKAFLRDDKDKAYEAYKNFDTFVKTENLSMSDYIIEFDKRYSKSKKYDMTLPEAVLAFKLLDNAGLSSRDKQLALTASSDVKIYLYESVFHWAKDCPDKVNSVNFVESESEIVENCNITLFTKEQPPVSEIFVLESACSAIIDTACTRTVCGENWFKQLLERTGDITTVTSSRAFKFGDGKVVNSFMRATIPAQIGSTNCKIETEIVKADIPLLLSKASLKKAGTVLDLKNDRAIMFNKPVELEFTSSGHYCVNIVKTKPEIQNLPVNVEENVLNITDDMSTAEKRKTLVKVHKQFGHATFNRLSKLINKAGMNNADTLELFTISL